MLASVGARLRRLNQGNSIEDRQQHVGHIRGQETEPQAMEVDQSDGQQCGGATEEQETETDPQPIEASQDETQVSDVHPFSVRTYT
jgi:hypothetical protein